MGNTNNVVLHQVADSDIGTDGTVEGKFTLGEILFFNYTRSRVNLAPCIGDIEHVTIAVAGIDRKNERNDVSILLGVNHEVTLIAVIGYRTLQQGIAKHFHRVVLTIGTNLNLRELAGV